MISLESPYQGNSNEYTQYTISQSEKKSTQNYSKSAAMAFCSKGLKKEFETAVVNEPSVFEPLKFYCRYGFQCVLTKELFLFNVLLLVLGVVHHYVINLWVSCVFFFPINLSCYKLL